MVTGARRVVCAQMGETRLLLVAKEFAGGISRDAERLLHRRRRARRPVPHQSHPRSVQLEVRAREMRLSPTLSEARRT